VSHLNVPEIRTHVRQLSECLHKVVAFYADIPRTRFVQRQLRHPSQSLQLGERLARFIDSSLALLVSLEQFAIHCEYLLGTCDPPNEPVYPFLLEFNAEFGARASAFLEHFNMVCPADAFEQITRELGEQSFARDSARPSRLPRIAEIRWMLAELLTATDIARVEELVALIVSLRADVDVLVRDVFATRGDERFRKRYNDAWDDKFAGPGLARVAKEFAGIVDEVMVMAKKLAEEEEAAAQRDVEDAEEATSGDKAGKTEAQEKEKGQRPAATKVATTVTKPLAKELATSMKVRTPAGVPGVHKAAGRTGGK
jgi:hypothetical protein